MSVDEKALEALGDDFYVAISDLTNNSRPMITSFTLLAQENIDAAEYLTRAVEKRIEKAVPHQKLYALYLLDSICKNVGSPYTLLFAQKIYQTYTQAYLLVDDQTRKKFIDLFKTWKNAKTSSGLPLFPDEPMAKIEQFLVRATAIHQQSSAKVNVAMLLQTIDKLLYLTNQRLLRSPNDQSIPAKIGIIKQLKFALQNDRSMTQDALVGVKRQLDEMTTAEENSLRSTPPIKSPPLSNPQPNLQNIFNSIQNPTATSLQTQDTGYNKVEDKTKNLTLLNSMINLKGSAIRTPTPTQTQQPVVKKNNLTSLLSSLEKQGLVKKKTPSPHEVPSTSLLNSILQKTKIASSNRLNTVHKSPLEEELEKFDINAKFVSLDPTSTYTALFVSRKTHKCGTCGKRFGDSQQEQAKSRDHLDWHFRINKKLKEGAIVQSRNWYLDDEQFVQFRDEDMFGSGEQEDKTTTEKNNAGSKERHYVVVPSDSEMSCLCGVCKEVLKARYDDDLGEWIWDDAVKKNGRIFHYSCYSETNTSSSLASIVGAKRTRDLSSLDFDMIRNVMKNVKLDDRSKVNTKG
ncbi:Protein PCF11 AltName: Full=protein 1 of CF I [Cyberlindnera jadinii]|uniref:CID domain-containing protein n=1 Tax=Cyberlindnera jadinii (strain ATCC 18201 / CBS 1600 / BCRC 20928 / JCM 3617 / NBRC 0987 / NRRL Y-1542) TaxID=983966 RepID=A0A0H5CKQ6_CYBJN|nr:Protein PCF11 AltName: Full=protein 1 of CF I [Cyberlindnera jadinii]